MVEKAEEEEEEMKKWIDESMKRTDRMFSKDRQDRYKSIETASASGYVVETSPFRFLSLEHIPDKLFVNSYLLVRILHFVCTD